MKLLDILFFLTDEMKTYTLNEVQDKLIGKKGTPKRDHFEYELQMDFNRKNHQADTTGT